MTAAALSTAWRILSLLVAAGTGITEVFRPMSASQAIVLATLSLASGLSALTLAVRGKGAVL
jgi:hypothetical protein